MFLQTKAKAARQIRTALATRRQEVQAGCSMPKQAIMALLAVQCKQFISLEDAIPHQNIRGRRRVIAGRSAARPKPAAGHDIAHQLSK